MKKEIYVIQDPEDDTYTNVHGDWVCDFKNAKRYDTYDDALNAADGVNGCVKIVKILVPERF